MQEEHPHHLSKCLLTLESPLNLIFCDQVSFCQFSSYAYWDLNPFSLALKWINFHQCLLRNLIFQIALFGKDLQVCLIELMNIKSFCLQMTYHHFLVCSPAQLAAFCPSFSHLFSFCTFIQQGQTLKIAKLLQQLNILSHHECRSISYRDQSTRFHHLPLYIDLSHCNSCGVKFDFF